ncbi:MAG TPA: glycosyltransferase family 2 protein [Candidatus Paceibacterota bacterium]|nr:glycosyltransferase family 2 protein [Candidatus Paceibacterota bacterium]HRZ34371.1 glycosyltransferase family 2 protein [Candidatus Paceibacterota bacterium]
MDANYKDTPYFHVAHARDLKGKDRALYRLLEIFPGVLSWGTLIGIVLISIYKPVVAAIFIIAFDLYWLLKTINLGFHQYHNWRRMKHNLAQDWYAELAKFRYEHLQHLVLLPFYDEEESVVETSLRAIVNSQYRKENLHVVLATEERAGEKAQEIAKRLKSKYQGQIGEILITIHPKDLPGEISGKGPNISYAAEEARLKIINANNWKYEDVIVSAFDVDTVVGPQYFACLTWHFLTEPEPLKKSFQPVPLYNNNIWEAPFLSRIAAMSSTFWQMIQQERPEKLVTFSSHAVPFKTLYEVNYWQRNMISDDSRIFWNLFLAHDGDYSVVPIAYPVSMDANLAPTIWQTFKNVYKQHRRWMWGVENIPYLLFGFIKNKKIPLIKKLQHLQIQITGFWSLATNPLLILFLGWLPIILGGDEFRTTVLSYNLPKVTRGLMFLAMVGLVLSAVIAVSLIPPLPPTYGKRKRRWTAMILQWALIPFSIIIFGSIPGLDSQTRLMIGAYFGKFWVTPKHRKELS